MAPSTVLNAGMIVQILAVIDGRRPHPTGRPDRD
jgi:hypothetical protein